MFVIVVVIVVVVVVVVVVIAMLSMSLNKLIGGKTSFRSGFRGIEKNRRKHIDLISVIIDNDTDILK